MQINAFSDYTLRTLIYLAITDDEIVSARTIAERFDISFHHIAKVTQWLSRHGYVIATYGRGGGIRLGLPPEKISIGAVMRATEKGTAIVECMKPGSTQCKIAPACCLAPALADAQEAFYKSLDQHTLASITENHWHLRMTLGMPIETD